jgi:hypothetical protein
MQHVQGEKCVSCRQTVTGQLPSRNVKFREVSIESIDVPLHNMHNTYYRLCDTVGVMNMFNKLIPSKAYENGTWSAGFIT